MVLASEIAASKQLLASLMMNTQQVETALPLMQEVMNHFEPLPPISDLTETELNDYSDLIQDYADLTIRTGDEVQARQLLRRLTLNRGKPHPTVSSA